MDYNADGIIDDPLATRMGRPRSIVPLEERKRMYNEKHKAWSKQMTREKRKNALLSLLADFGISPNNVDEGTFKRVMDDASLVIYYKKA